MSEIPCCDACGKACLPEELTDCYCWQLPDTNIYMFRYPDASFAIVYTDSIYFESATGFNVSGL